MKAWFDEEGERLSANWFKQHPLETLGLLALGIMIIVLVSI